MRPRPQHRRWRLGRGPNLRRSVFLGFTGLTAMAAVFALIPAGPFVGAILIGAAPARRCRPG